MTQHPPLPQRPELTDAAFNALWEKFRDRFPLDSNPEVARAFAEAVADALTPPADIRLQREPVFFRYRHSEQEKWHYGPAALNWWECQPLYAVTESPESEAAVSQVVKQLRDVGEAALMAQMEQLDDGVLNADQILELCHSVGMLVARGALPFASATGESVLAYTEGSAARDATAMNARPSELLSAELDRLNWSLLYVLQDVSMTGDFDRLAYDTVDQVRVALRKLSARLVKLETAGTRRFSEEMQHRAVATWADGYHQGKRDSHVQFGDWFGETTESDWSAFNRFYACLEDGEGYDVPADAMRRLAELGLVRKVRGTAYEFTALGLSMQSYNPDEATSRFARVTS
jgi:hypothetical protein